MCKFVLHISKQGHGINKANSFPGIAAITSFYLNAANPNATAFGSIFQIGWGFAIGIAFAIITCASTSGGHFNPAITICFAVWQGFPWKKVPYYIFSQVFGAFMAGMLLMGMYWYVSWHYAFLGIKIRVADVVGVKQPLGSQETRSSDSTLALEEYC